MRDQGKQKSLKFEGTIETDGIGVSVIKQNFSTSRKQPGESSSKVKSKNMDEDEDQVKHVETLTRSQHAELQGKCVLIDPNRRDLLYCMKEDSTIDNKKLFRFTQSTRSKLTRHFKKLQKKIKTISGEISRRRTFEAKIIKRKALNIS